MNRYLKNLKSCCKQIDNSAELHDISSPKITSVDTSKVTSQRRNDFPVVEPQSKVKSLKITQNLSLRESQNSSKTKELNKDATVKPSSTSHDLKDSRISKLQRFTYSELKFATRNFAKEYLLGEGGFGAVYKGVILDGKKKWSSFDVAIKKLDSQSLQGHKEWMTEVSLLRLVEHENLVKLIGYCSENEKRLLVYEFMQNTSLDNFLFDLDTPPLNWETRIRIALGTAKALAYLHEEMHPPIMYRDFKTSNILLDSDFNPKLSDFGLAREGPVGEETHVSTMVRGTIGYASPEYMLTGHLTAKNDVWGFGVVLLELLTGRPALDPTMPPREQNLVNYCRRSLQKNSRFQTVTDPRLYGMYPVEALAEAANLANICLFRDPHKRPSMSDVVAILKCIQESEDDHSLSSEST